MEPRANDPARWRDAVLPHAEDRLVDAIDQLADFPVLDGTVMRVIAIADDPETTTADLVDVLEGDPTFAANLLRYANSPALARPIRAKTVRQAVMLVGRKALRRLALEAATYRFFERAPGTGSARGELHVHAIAVAAVAAAAAEQVGAHGDGPHLGGLLHDMGKLVLPIAFGAEACDRLAATVPDGAERVLRERELFGIDHALAGALVAERWGVASDVVAAIAWHHGGPTGVGCPSPQIACVQIGNQVVHMVAGHGPDHVLLQVALERAGVSATALDAMAEHTLPSTRPADEDSLARRATETERLSQTDELTGVDNRRHWLHATRAALAEPGGDQGAIVLCDVGALDEVNRAHGTEMGDVVLTEVARVLAGHGRPGRLAGGLFGVWLRAGAPGDAAARIADEVRAAFGDDARPDVDVCLGLAEAAVHGTDLAAVLEAALLSLRAAKDARGSYSANGSSSARSATRPASSVL
jgi:putative nucleotidyltransferase with HDIG domain/diguanylate cyclase (GGDEF)-like protein